MNDLPDGGRQLLAGILLRVTSRIAGDPGSERSPQGLADAIVTELERDGLQITRGQP